TPLFRHSSLHSFPTRRSSDLAPTGSVCADCLCKSPYRGAKLLGLLASSRLHSPRGRGSHHLVRNHQATTALLFVGVPTSGLSFSALLAGWRLHSSRRRGSLDSHQSHRLDSLQLFQPPLQKAS